MPGTFGGIEIASRALRVNQQVIEVTGHNLANVNTPGYTRQTANIVATDPYMVPGPEGSVGPLQVGTGVEVASITRVRDEFIERQLQSGSAEQGQLNTLRDLIQRAQGAYNEPGTGGLSSLLTAFFNSFQQLSQNAESGTLRETVRQQAETLSRQFNQVSTSLSSMEDDIAQRAQRAVEEVNGLAQQVAALNLDIKKQIALGNRPNDLLDKRDALIQQLGELVGATTTAETDASGRQTGAVNVAVNGFVLVDSDHAGKLPSDFKFLNGIPQLTDGSSDIPVTGGELGGLLRASSLIAGYRSDLNTVASTLIIRVNAQHEAGYGLDGSTGNPFFAGTDASNIAVSQGVENSLDAIAAATPPVSGSTVAPGNGDNALAIANIGSARLSGSNTLGQFYAAKVAQVGADAQAFGQQADNQEQVMQQLNNLRSQTSGVSVDEEMTRMIQYQRSYQAAARLLTTMDSMLETLLNAIGQ
jgi:flagellar hook-associated protein 1 FlgK